MRAAYRLCSGALAPPPTMTTTPTTLLLLLTTALLLCAAGRCRASGQKSPEPGMIFTRHPQPFTAPLGDEVYFECGLNLAAEKFAWKHRPLGSSRWLALDSVAGGGGKTSRHVVYFDDGTKAGDYRCIAFYGTSGLASDPARLTQARIDKFTDRGNVYLRVPAGGNVPITCPVPNSVPEAVIQFFKDGNSVENASLTGSKVMVIERARPSDSGSYHCKANNYITSETYTSNHKTVLIVDKNATDQEPYFIKQPQSEYRVQRGKNVTLECFAVGYPVPQVTWSKLGSSLPSESTFSTTGLTLSNVQPGDRGEYDCLWTNRAGQAKSAIILTVVEPPTVLRAPRLSTYLEGGSLELSCNATGYPAPSIEWLINGETLAPGKNLNVQGYSLFINVVEKRHAGIVQCVASNEYGSHSGYNYLRVTPKQHVGGGGGAKSRGDYGPAQGPGRRHTRIGARRRGKNGKRKDNDVMVPPNQPNITRLSDVSVMVRWSVPENHGLPILFFKVQYRELGQKTNSKQAKWMTANTEIPSHIRSFEVNDLQPDHTYRFRIAAVYSNNDNAVSPISVRFHLSRRRNFESNAMPIPLLTHTEALSPNEVLLIWQNTNRSAEIDGFYVYHRASTSAGDYIKTTVEGKNSTNITISHLQPDTTYEFKVQSFSVGAASEFSQILGQKTRKVVTEAPIPQVLAENKVNTVESAKSSNMYAIIGGVLGGAILLGGLAAIGVAYKRNRHKQSRDSSQDQGKPITNGRVMNGGITDSKINITSNPLAGLESTEDPMQPKSGQQSPMEMASFLNGQNNNGSGSNSGAVINNVHQPLATSSPPPPPQSPASSLSTHHQRNHVHISGSGRHEANSTGTGGAAASQASPQAEPPAPPPPLLQAGLPIEQPL